MEPDDYNAWPKSEQDKLAELQQKSPDSPLEDLGWANSDPSLFPKWNYCHEVGHVTQDMRCPSGRGYENKCVCKTCGYVFSYNSSD